MAGRTVQHQFLPHPQSVRFVIETVIRPDKGDYLLQVNATAIKGGATLWDFTQYVPRTAQGIQSMLNEIHDCLYHLSDHIDVTVPSIRWEDLNDSEF